MKSIIAFSLFLPVAAWCCDTVDGRINPYGDDTNSLRIYSYDGAYRGNLNSNPYDPNSISNEYGRYGSGYSPDSINNPYGDVE